MAIRELIERCRRQQQQLPGQLELPETSDHLQSVTVEFPPNEDLMGVYREQSDFMRTVSATSAISDSVSSVRVKLSAATAEIPWATAFEAMEQWRRETYEDFGFYPGWIEV